MTWLRLDTDFPRHEIIGRLAEALKIDPDRAAMLWIRVWCGFGDYQPSGIVEGVTDTTVEEWARWKGKRGVFAKAFRKLGVDGDGKVNGWWRQEALLKHQVTKRKRRGTDETDIPEPGENPAKTRRESGKKTTPENRPTSADNVDVDGNGVRTTSSTTAGAIPIRFEKRVVGQRGGDTVLGFLRVLPPKERVDSWAGILGSCLDGLGLPEGKPCSLEELAVACTDFIAAAPDQWGGAHFRSFVTRAMRGTRAPERAARQSDYDVAIAKAKAAHAG